MCEIMDIFEFNGGTVIGCSEYDGDFMKAKTLKIIDKDNNVFSTSDFTVDKTRPCFSKGGLP